MRSPWGSIANPHAKVFDPRHPQVPPLEHDPSSRMKIMFNMSFICENTHKVWYKILWNLHGNRNLMIFDLLISPKVASLTLGWKFYLHSVLLITPVDLICHMTMFEIFFFTPWAPQRPTPGAWPRRQNENPVRYVLYISFVRIHTKLGIKNLWNWLCNWYLKMIFDLLPPPQGPRGRGQK